MVQYTIKTTDLTEHTYESPKYEFETIGLKGSMNAAFVFHNVKEKTNIYYPTSNVISLEIKERK